MMALAVLTVAATPESKATLPTPMDWALCAVSLATASISPSTRA